LHYVVILPHYEDGTNTSTLAGQNEYHREKMDSNQEKWIPNKERMEAKSGAEIKTIQEKMDYEQEEMKAQVGSLASQIYVNQEEMKTRLRAIQC
jgi:hypothetical protein